MSFLRKADFELKNPEWHLKVVKGKISIEHRISGQKLEDLTLKDLQTLSGVVGSSVVQLIGAV